MKTRTWALTVFLAAVGCSRQEAADLDRTYGELRIRRDKDAAIAEQLDDYRAKDAGLDEDIERVTSRGLGVPVATSLEGLRTRMPDLVIRQTSESTFAIAHMESGTERLSAAAQAMNFLAFTKIVVEADRWHIEVPVTDPAIQQVAAQTPLPPKPTPTKAAFSYRKAKDRRKRIENVQAQIDELEKLIGDCATSS